MGVLGIEADGLVKVLNGSLVLAQPPVGNTPVVVSVKVLGIEANGLVIVLNGSWVLAQLWRAVPSGYREETELTKKAST